MLKLAGGMKKRAGQNITMGEMGENITAGGGLLKCVWGA
jgi:hypothetical protein